MSAPDMMSKEKNKIGQSSFIVYVFKSNTIKYIID